MHNIERACEIHDLNGCVASQRGPCDDDGHPLEDMPDQLLCKSCTEMDKKIGEMHAESDAEMAEVAEAGKRTMRESEEENCDIPEQQPEHGVFLEESSERHASAEHETRLKAGVGKRAIQRSLTEDYLGQGAFELGGASEVEDGPPSFQRKNTNGKPRTPGKANPEEAAGKKKSPQAAQAAREPVSLINLLTVTILGVILDCNSFSCSLSKLLV